jgi:hypothetical protein
MSGDYPTQRADTSRARWPAKPHHNGRPTPEYRDPWSTGGWFAKLVREREAVTPKKPNYFPTSGDPRAIAVILLVQTLLSVRLLRGNSGSGEENLSLWAGYMQVTHQITLSQLEGLVTSFPGSPEIYPPFGALVAQSGGLIGARLLSLAFMLCATATLYAVTRRLWDSRMPAIFAAALFGWLGSEQFLGSLATSGAMALFLLALATWLAVRAVPCLPRGRVVLLAAAVICLAAATATEYVTVFYIPVVIAVFFLATWRARPSGGAFRQGCVLAVTTTAVLAGAYLVAGPHYRAGVNSALFTVEQGHAASGQVLSASGRLLGLVFIVAVAAATAITVRYHDRATALLGWVLAAAALLASAQAARLHTTVGLYRVAGFSAWFTCAVAGWILAYAYDAGRRAGGAADTRPRSWAGRGVAILVTVASAAIGVASSTAQFHSWPDSSVAAAELNRLVKPGGVYLAENYGQFTYDLRAEVTLRQWRDTESFSFPDPKTKQHLAEAGAYAAAVRDRYFSVIILDFQDTVDTDKAIERDIRTYHDYRLVKTIPFSTSAGRGSYQFWIPAS